MNRSDLIKGITHYLTHLRTQVEHLNSLNLQDDNVHAENFFRDLINLALDYDLKNINIVEKNARAIDLGDERKRIAIQVTSSSDLGIIRHTYDGFVKGGLDSTYDRLLVLIIGEKRAYRENSLGGDGVFRVSLEEDVWGMKELIRQVGDLSIGKLQKCRDFLSAELRIPEPRETNKVNTLIRLIDVSLTSKRAKMCDGHAITCRQGGIVQTEIVAEGPEVGRQVLGGQPGQVIEGRL